MVRKYQRKTQKAAYSTEDLQRAIEHVKSGKCGTLRASKLFNIPRSTLKDHIKGRRGAKSDTMGRPTALPAKDEEALAKGLKCLEKWGFGLCRKEILEIVGKYVTQKQLKTPFKENVPGEDWFLNFKKRHNLSIKKPEALEYARKKNTDPFIIYPYFQLLKDTIQKLNLQDKPSNIWNMDETSFCSDPSKTKVVGEKGRSSTRIVSGPGRTNTSVLFAVAADGQKAPPLIIYKGKSVWDSWIADEKKEYPGTTYSATENGWMESQVFKNYFVKTFIPLVGKDDPVLVIYDGHTTHIDIDVVEAAVAANITIIKLPPHSSHLLQPLDLAVFKSIKVAWDSSLVKWQRNNLGQKLPKRKLAEMVGTVWKDADPKIIREGFKKGGIYPYNCDVIPKEKFDPLQLKRWQQRTPNNENEPPRELDVELLEPAGQGEHIPVEDLELLDSEDGRQHSIQLDEDVRLLETEDKQEHTPSAEDAGLIEREEGKGEHKQTPAEREEDTFEALLLDLVKGNQPNNITKTSRKKICSGAELITSEDVRKRLKEAKEYEAQKKSGTKRKKAATAQTTTKGQKNTKEENSTKDKKINQVKRNRMNENTKTIYDSETEEEYSDLQLNDEESDFETLSEVGAEALDALNLGKNVIEIGDWILTRLNSERKTCQYFIGKVEDVDQDTGNPTVKFVRRIKSRTVFCRPAFTWPDVEDISEVETSAVICTLPHPIMGRRGEIKFDVSFSGYTLN